MKIEFELLPPVMPNFAPYAMPPAPRQEGFKPNECFPIADFNEQQAEEYADLMREAFMKHWRVKQAQKKSPLSRKQF